MQKCRVSYHDVMYTIEYFRYSGNGVEVALIWSDEGEVIPVDSPLGDKLARRQFKEAYKSPLAKYRKDR